MVSSGPNPERLLDGKVVLVTGGTSGIGEATARRLAEEGATVVIVGQDPGRAADSISRLGRGSPPERFDLVVADLSVSEGIQIVARHVLERYGRLDLLVNNAGMFFARRQETREGVERTWALNVLAPFRLTMALRGPLSAAGHARVVNVASAAHRGRSLDFGDLEGRRHYRGFRTYGRSKVALILLTYEFARRWDGTGVAFFAVHPGFVRTRFGLNNPGPVSWLIRFLGYFFALRPEQGAVTPVYAAVSPELSGRTGLYLDRGKVSRSSAASRDRESGRRLWELLTAADARMTAADPVRGSSGSSD